MRISWDEAADLIADEIKRIHKEYGPLAILVQGDGHGECKFIHAPHGCSDAAPRQDGRFHPAGAQPRQLGRLVLGIEAHLGQGPGGHDEPGRQHRERHHPEQRHGGGLGRRPGDDALGLPGPVRQPAALLLERDRPQAGLHLPRAQLRRAPSTPTSGSPSSPTPTPPCSWPSSTCGSPKARTTRST